jgi:hypothetical protein
MIHARLYKHLTLNSILTPNQFGFRTDYSTEQAIFSLINSVLEAMDKKRLVGEQDPRKAVSNMAASEKVIRDSVISVTI